MTYVTNEPWATHTDLTALGVDYVGEGLTDPQVDMALAVASDILFLLTASQWPGTATEKVRPQARWIAHDRPSWWLALPGYPQSPYGWCSCNRGRDTGCNFIPEIRLPRRDIDAASVVVTLDGVAFTDVRVDDGRWLVRTDGNGWPCCQNLLLADTELHTWSVEYDWGALPDQGGVNAAASLGHELAIAFSGNTSKCRLPKRITHMTRGSTSIAVLDPLTLFKDGLTGITEVDLWLMSKMLGKARRPGTVTRVGQNRAFRRTG